MVTNKRVALVFRLCSMVFALLGILKQSGVFTGEFGFGGFMYYTLQSNLLAVVFFAFLSVRTWKSLRDGLRGSVGWHSRLGMVCAVDLLVTMIIFWTLLARVVPRGYLWSFENLAVHTITPLLCLLDYVFFSEPRRLKYRDVYYVCIFPLSYVVFSTIAGLMGYVYYFTSEFGDVSSSAALSVPVKVPYFFLDYERLGILVVAFIAGTLVFFLLLSHIIFFIDQKLRKLSH